MRLITARRFTCVMSPGSTDGMAEPSNYTRLRFGPAEEGADLGKEYQAVNIAVAKKKGTNAVKVAEDVIEKLHSLQGEIIPDNIQVRVTRDYGETANHKVNELITHLVIAIVTVLLLVLFALGWREAFIVAVSIPIIYSLTLLVNYWFGYTINRVTLFALVLALGLLVDDPIVDVENIYRHFKMKKEPPRQAVLTAVDEVRAAGHRGDSRCYPVVSADVVHHRDDGALYEADGGQPAADHDHVAGCCLYGHSLDVLSYPQRGIRQA